MIFMVQVNRVYLIIIFFNRPQFLVDSNELLYMCKDNTFFIGKKNLPKKKLPKTIPSRAVISIGLNIII